jgi:F0F1-type ATP synthase assembly protein I
MKTILGLQLFLVFSTFTLTAQEKQVAFDHSGKIRIVDALLAEKINYFMEYTGFHEALLFQQNDSVYVLEVSTLQGGEIYRTRIKLSKEDTELLRNDISVKLQEYSPKSLLNQEGRTQLLLINSILSYSFYGMAASTILTDDFNAAIYLISAGAGFLGPILMTRDKEVTMSQAIMTGYGQSRGILHGMMLPVLLSKDPPYRLSLALGMAGSIAEGLIGFNWAKRNAINIGQATTIGFYGDLGMVLGLGATHALGFYEGNHDFNSNIAAATVLIGGAGGLLFGKKLADKDYYSQGDIGMSSSLSLTGAYLPISIMSFIKPVNPRWFTAVGTLGAVGGLYLGDKLAQQYDFSARQSIFASLSMIGGGFIGAGIGHLIDESANNSEWYDYDPKWLIFGSALGAAAGLGLSLRNYTKDINKEHKDLSFRMQMNPLGFMNSQLTAGDPTGRTAIPILMGQLRF